MYLTEPMNIDRSESNVWVQVTVTTAFEDSIEREGQASTNDTSRECSTVNGSGRSRELEMRNAVGTRFSIHGVTKWERMKGRIVLECVYLYGLGRACLASFVANASLKCLFNNRDRK